MMKLLVILSIITIFSSVTLFDEKDSDNNLAFIKVIDSLCKICVLPLMKAPIYGKRMVTQKLYTLEKTPTLVSKKWFSDLCFFKFLSLNILSCSNYLSTV